MGDSPEVQESGGSPPVNELEVPKHLEEVYASVPEGKDGASAHVVEKVGRLVMEMNRGDPEREVGGLKCVDGARLLLASGSARQGPITPRCPLGSVRAFWTEKAVNLTHDVRRNCGDWMKIVKLWEVDFVRRESGGSGPAEEVFLWAHDEDCVGVCWERIRELAYWDLN